MMLDGRRRSRYEVILDLLLTRKPLTTAPLEREWMFARERGRKWRFDFAWPDLKVGVEFDGGGRKAMMQMNPRTRRLQPVAVGRHGSAADYEKLNAAAELGWRVLRFNPEMLRRPDEVLTVIRRTLEAAELELARRTDSTSPDPSS